MVRDEATGAHELRARRMKMFLTMTLDDGKKKKEAHVCIGGTLLAALRKGSDICVSGTDEYGAVQGCSAALPRKAVAAFELPQREGGADDTESVIHGQT